MDSWELLFSAKDGSQRVYVKEYGDVFIGAERLQLVKGLFELSADLSEVLAVVSLQDNFAVI